MTRLGRGIGAPGFAAVRIRHVQILPIQSGLVEERPRAGAGGVCAAHQAILSALDDRRLRLINNLTDHNRGDSVCDSSALLSGCAEFTRDLRDRESHALGLLRRRSSGIMFYLRRDSLYKVRGMTRAALPLVSGASSGGLRNLRNRRLSSRSDVDIRGSMITRRAYSHCFPCDATRDVDSPQFCRLARSSQGNR